MKRPAVVIATTLLGLVLMWIVLLRPPSTPPSVRLAGAPVAVTSGTAAQAGSGAGSTPAAAPTRTAAARRPAALHHAPARRVATASSPPAGSPRVASAPAQATSGSRSTPAPRQTPSAKTYTFAPAAAASGPTPTADLRLSDLSLHAGQTVTADVPMTSAGALLFDAHTATSSSTSGSYPLSALRACVEYAGQTPCTPVATPLPAYWPVTAADVARHQSYRIRILATANSSLLAGIHVGWRGPKDVTVGGLALPGGCQASVSPGYTAGCGLKYKVSTTSAGPVTVTTPTSGLEISLKNTTTNAKVYSGPLTSPQQMQVPSAGEWTGHIYPANGSPVASLTVTFTWE